MIVIEKETKEKRDGILKKAESYFGPEGYGLEITDKDECCMSFEGAGGYVNVRIIENESGKDKVEVEAREFEHQAKDFLGKL